MEFSTILWIAVGVVAFIIIVSIIKCIRRCPSDKILVVYGKVGNNASGEAQSARCIHGGTAFVVPIFQDYQFLDLTPFSLNIDLRGALSKQNIRVDVPASFTVGISTEPRVMQNAAERLLGLSLGNVVNLANEIILGQLRLIIAQMDIEELNTQRDQFMDAVQKNVEFELKKIGLRLINANITDIRDESGYIDALGKEAEAKAINEAKKNVAEREREGNTGEKKEKAAEAIEIAKTDAEQRKQVAEQEAAAVAAEKEAESKRRAAIAARNAEALAAEKEAEATQRSAVAARNAEAIAAENQAAAQIALSEASRREAEAEARSRAYSAEKVQNARALGEAYAAEEKAELARAERQKATMQADVLVQAEIEKKRIEIAAEAEAEAIRRKAKGQADALLLKMQAEADGYKAQLAKRAEGFLMLVKSANGDPDAAVRLMMTDKIEELVKTQVEAIKGVNIDKITVWDTMGGQDGSSTTSNFLSSMMKAIPPMKDVYDMVGLEVPANLAKPAGSNKPVIASSKPKIDLSALDK